MTDEDPDEEDKVRRKSTYKSAQDSRQKKKSTEMLFVTVRTLMRHNAVCQLSAVSSTILRESAECNDATFGSRLRALQSNGLARPVEVSITNRARRWYLNPRGVKFYENNLEEFKDK